MVCIFCESETDLLIPVPDPPGSACAGDSNMCCKSCAIEMGYFCLKHDIPHNVFHYSGKAFCGSCLNDQVLSVYRNFNLFSTNVNQKIGQAETFHLIVTAIKMKQYLRMTDLRMTISVMLVHAMAESEQSYAQVIEKICAKKNFDSILPVRYRVQLKETFH